MRFKFLSNFFRSLNTLLVNCEVSLTLTWSENCVITSKATREADPDVDHAVDGINNPTNAVFTITDCKLYVPVVTLSAEDDNKLLEQLKTRFKRTITWKKYRSKMSNQTKNNNLNYLINKDNEYDRTSFSKYYIPNFNVLNDGKPFFEIPVKNKGKAYEAIAEMSKNNDYATGNLLDFGYFKDRYKLIAIDLSK